MSHFFPSSPLNPSRLFDGITHQQAAFYAQKFPARDPRFIESIKNYLLERHHEKITLDELCKHFHCDKFRLLRQFKEYTGLSPINYLIALRIEEAKKRMYSDLPLVHIALECGFYDQSHFSNCFLKFVGLTPQVYRKNCLK